MSLEGRVILLTNILSNNLSLSNCTVYTNFLTNGFIFLGIPPGIQEIIQGVILLGSISLVVLMRKLLKVLNLLVRV